MTPQRSPQLPPAPESGPESGLRIALAPVLTAPLQTPTDRDLLTALGKVIGLADSIQLHGALGRRQPAAAMRNDKAPADAARNAVLAGRGALLDLVADRLESQNPGEPHSFPDLVAPPGFDGLSGPQRLQRFYTRMQQEMAVQVQTLRGVIQRQLKAMSPALARLAELDLQVGQLVTSRLEEAFAAIPRLLSGYCEGVAADSKGESRGWQSRVREQTHTLLLAELDVRLQPVFGLAEAADHSNGADKR